MHFILYYYDHITRIMNVMTRCFTKTMDLCGEMVPVPRYYNVVLKLIMPVRNYNSAYDPAKHQRFYN